MLLTTPEPIIQSLLDLDFYKLTMAQVAWKRHKKTPVTFGFTNRTKKVLLADCIPEEDLKRELDHVRTLRFTEDELKWLSESKHIPRGLFCDGFIDFLRTLQLPEYELRKTPEGQYDLRSSGPWPQVTLWETLMLSVINELYYRELEKHKGISRASAINKGRMRLISKLIEIGRRAPSLRYSDFGTRRRYCREYQELAVAAAIPFRRPALIGTSNVLLAKKFGIPPIGTFAHEMYMVYSAIYRIMDMDAGALNSHNKVLSDWWDEYGERLSVALTDQYGSDFFFRTLTPDLARLYRGLRHDSGDPFKFGEKTIAFYGRLGIDPLGKTVVFSDGLDEQLMIRLYERFHGRIGLAFGWGTNFTGDIGYETLSLVVKAVSACGLPTVKLSDNMAKAMGPQFLVDEYKKLAGYAGEVYEECRS